jgi:hypothetical protein
MPRRFAVQFAAKEKNILPRRPDLRVDPPSPTVKRLPGVAGSVPQGACVPGLIVFRNGTLLDFESTHGCESAMEQSVACVLASRAIREGFRLPHLAIDSSNGLHIKVPEWAEVSISKETVASIERMWDSTLQWSSSNPWLFVVVLCFLLKTLSIIVSGRNERAKMMLDYENARRNARTQIPLPFNDQDDTL